MTEGYFRRKMGNDQRGISSHVLFDWHRAGDYWLNGNVPIVTVVDISVSGVIIGITGLHAVHKCTVIIRVSLGMDLAEKKPTKIDGVSVPFTTENSYSRCRGRSNQVHLFVHQYPWNWVGFEKYFHLPNPTERSHWKDDWQKWHGASVKNQKAPYGFWNAVLVKG